MLLVDDVLATGGTVAATRRLVERVRCACAHAVAVLMDLSFLPGREAIGDLPAHQPDDRLSAPGTPA